MYSSVRLVGTYKAASKMRIVPASTSHVALFSSAFSPSLFLPVTKIPRVIPRAITDTKKVKKAQMEPMMPEQAPPDEAYGVSSIREATRAREAYHRKRRERR